MSNLVSFRSARVCARQTRRALVLESWLACEPYNLDAACEIGFYYGVYSPSRNPIWWSHQVLHIEDYLPVPSGSAWSASSSCDCLGASLEILGIPHLLIMVHQAAGGKIILEFRLHLIVSRSLYLSLISLLLVLFSLTTVERNYSYTFIGVTTAGLGDRVILFWLLLKTFVSICYFWWKRGLCFDKLFLAV